MLCVVVSGCKQRVVNKVSATPQCHDLWLNFGVLEREGDSGVVSDEAKTAFYSPK